MSKKILLLFTVFFYNHLNRSNAAGAVGRIGTLTCLHTPLREYTTRERPLPPR
jgi:hypothetical protein